MIRQGFTTDTPRTGINRDEGVSVGLRATVGIEGATRAIWGATLTAVLVFALSPRPAAAATPTATEFFAGATHMGETLEGITAGPDGNLWFAKDCGNPSCSIGRITPSGTETDFTAGISGAPAGITRGPDGNLWFAERGAPNFDRIGRITPSGTVTEFHTGITQGSGPYNITPGPDGNLWFTEFLGDGIGRITPSGTVTEFTPGISHDAMPTDITRGPDGNLWFTEPGVNAIGRITPTGTVTEFTSGISPDAELQGITTGPDGNLWATEHGVPGVSIDTPRIARITPAGAVTEFSAGIPPESDPGDITVGADGNLWFTEVDSTGGGYSGKIGRITPSGVVTEFTHGLSALPETALWGITPGPDANLWFTEWEAHRVGRINTAMSAPEHESTTPVVLPGSPGVTQGPASPYPTMIHVAHVSGTIKTLRVRLTGLDHDFADDIDALLVGPQGQSCVLMSDAGGRVTTGTTLRFSPGASRHLPNGGPLVSGSYKATNYGSGDTFAFPAPAGPHGTLHDFHGTDPNGNWSLYLMDDASGRDGTLFGGWGLSFTMKGSG